MPAQPQDHKPAKGKPFRFTDGDGKSHTLPLASAGRDRLTGRDIRDATLGGEIGQLGYLFKVLEAAEPNEKALDALYAMPQNEMLEVLQAWGDHGDGDGASLGE
jgi:hypothetical protein